MVFIEFLIKFISSYDFLISFIAALFTREESALILSFLTSQGIVNFYTFFLFFYVGVLTSDLVTFLVIARSKFFGRILKYFKRKEKFREINEGVNKFTRKNLFLSMVLGKFLYGTRTLILLKLGRKKSNFPRIFYYDILLTFIWLSIISTIGWFAGKQFNLIIETFENIRLAIISAVLILGVFYVLKFVVKRKVVKKLFNFPPPINLIYRGN